MLIPRSTMQARVMFLCTFSAALATFHSPSHALNALFHRLMKVGLRVSFRVVSHTEKAKLDSLMIFQAFQDFKVLKEVRVTFELF